ncbi:RNA polymerase factor sigma-54 [Ralstonia pickettii]|uniref:RNA polymerase factor sigma-54 n=1 Tax=Ralstonia pickettii TaxID=329 RepID=UPI0027154C62|nr:RNA polymerase factor sigma-54 [Ralstonia pickettii]WKZ86475.1 RNA polymerase factor sigma-54 [Ralstonia pickettii]
MDASLQLQARQTMALTPRLQHSLKLLQLTAAEFRQEWEAALASNPFLEAVEESDAGGDATQSNAGEVSASEHVPTLDADREEAPLPEPGWQPEISRASAPSDDTMREVVGSDSMRERLWRDLCTYPLSPRDTLIAHALVEALDADGYLRQSFSEIAPLIPVDPPPEPKEIEIVLKLVQSLGPTGIAARSVQECLLLQLREMKGERAQSPTLELARRIVERYLDEVAAQDMPVLARKLRCDRNEVGAALALLRTLNPRPGNDSSHAQPLYVVPDVTVVKHRKRWVVRLNRDCMPRARLNQLYVDLLGRARGNNSAGIAQQLEQARWLLRNSEQRFETIKKVAEAIVERQRHFFEYGEVALSPMGLRDIAEAVGVHESTVSRATLGKYMATPRGVFEFKHFFTRSLATGTGGQCSTAATRAMLQELIAKEDPRAPLSDVALQRHLRAQGVKVARRTLTKYRSALQIPPAEMRRARVALAVETA